MMAGVWFVVVVGIVPSCERISYAGNAHARNDGGDDFDETLALAHTHTHKHARKHNNNKQHYSFPFSA